MQHACFRLKLKTFSLISLIFLSFFSLPQSSLASISFSQDTNLSLTGISNGDLVAASGSSADYLSFSGAELTISGIPDGSYFTLKTPTYNNALKITPSGGTATTTFNSANLSSGAITAWTINASSPTATIAHFVSANANTWYQISVGGTAYNSYQTNSSGELTFTYSGGFSSSKSFTIAQDTSAPTSFSLTSPVSGASISNSLPTFTWNASSDPDFSYYELYIDGNLNSSNITTNSKTVTSSISCGNHTWYVRAVDNAGNGTNASAFNLTISCAGGAPGAVSVNIPQPRLQTISPDGTVTYLDQQASVSSSPTQTTVPTNSTPSLTFSKPLKLKQTSSEIKNLQISLNKLGFTISKSGPGSSGNETNYFGKSTTEAIKKFQCKYNIACNNNTVGYGLFGPKTRTKLNELLNNQKETSTSIKQTETIQNTNPASPPTSASAISVIQKQLETLQDQLIESLKKQIEELAKKTNNQ